MTSPDQIKILVTRKFPDIGTDILTRHGFRLTQWPQERPMTYEQLRSRVPGHQALFCTLTDRIDRDLIRENPQLQLISQFAVGYDFEHGFCGEAQLEVKRTSTSSAARSSLALVSSRAVSSCASS